MLVAVQEVRGCGNIPLHRMSATKWLKSRGIAVTILPGDGRKPEFVRLSDLPAPERRAYLERVCDAASLPAGLYDDEAHRTFMAASASKRDAAERKAAMARYLLSMGTFTGWPDRLALMRKKFGANGTSKPSLKRLSRDVKGIDPINFAPALLAAHKPTSKCAPVSEQAWAFFMTTIRDAAPEFPLIQAWRDVRDVAKKRGWDWPSHPTIARRWNALPVAQRLVARHGEEAARKRLAQPAHRDKTTIGPLEWVSLDGRTQDFWVDFGDGRAARPTMLALVDVASNVVLRYLLTRSENATDTVRLIRNTCETYGTFDRLYTDNGSSFAGHLVAGGNVHKFRKSGAQGVKPLGVCFHLGITIHFALPKNAQAKIAERTFASLSRVIDDRPEFAGAHAGHSPGATPGANVVPVPVEVAERVIQREVERYNRETGRCSQGAHGRSYQQVLEAGLEDRIERRATARQLYLAGLVYRPCAVDRNGQIKADTWIYGGQETQETLLPYHGDGQRILLGRDPDDFTAPALAFDEAGKLICEGIEYVQRGDYGSVDGVRTAAKNRKFAREKTSEANAAINHLSDEAFRQCLDDLPEFETATPLPQKKVVGGLFGAPLRHVSADDAPQKASVPLEFYQTFDRKLAAKSDRGA